jgi:aryl-alcohol dehydrogenase-like predicted oxidoreductase
MKSPLMTMTLAIRGARRLGGSDLVVSEACLGTMTFGVQNTQEDAFQQMDYAREFGINFIDTAELYPVPLTAPKWKAGATEKIVGNYLHQIGSAARDELVIATKVAGYFPKSSITAERYDPPLTSDPYPDCRLDAKSVQTACEASLRRLQTDRIDLFQLHWPDRYLPMFGQMEFDYDQMRDDAVPIAETAAALRDLLEAGKIRYIGLSNESTFGVCEWIKATEALGIRDKLVSIQNSYSLLDRRFDSELAEACANYKIGLLPWSVLAGGLLSGKYRKNVSRPATAGSRFVQFKDYMKRWNPASASPQTLEAVEEYAKIAEQVNLTPAQLAIAFVRSRRFVKDAGSTIVGSTTVEQLQENLQSFEKDDAELDSALVDAINTVHMKCRDPSCSL